MQITIALAHSADEEATIEQVLDEAGIAYSESLEADERAKEGAVCYLARGYAVSEADAATARRLLFEKGLASCVGA